MKRVTRMCMVAMALMALTACGQVSSGNQVFSDYNLYEYGEFDSSGGAFAMNNYQ